MTRSGKPRRLIYKLLTLLASCTVSILLAEGFVREFLPFQMMAFSTELVRLSENPTLLYELNPSHRDHNRKGFRGSDTTLPKPDGVFRVVLLGDSIAYGVGLGNDETISAQLEAILNETAERGSPRFEVLNFGVPGYSIIQEVEQLRSQDLEFEPDLAILVVCLNDWDPQTFVFEALLATRGSPEMRFISHVYDPSNSWMNRLLYRSHLFRLTIYHLQRFAPWGPSTWGRSHADPGGTEVADSTSVLQYYDDRPFYSERFQHLSELLDERGIPLIVALAPWNLDDRYGSRYKELAKLCAEPACRLVDFRESLRVSLGVKNIPYPNDYYMGDGVHLTPRGNRLMADILAREARLARRDRARP